MTQDSTTTTNSVVTKHLFRYQSEFFLVLFIILFAIIGLTTCFGLSSDVAYITTSLGT